jgi:hypothetical protein
MPKRGPRPPSALAQEVAAALFASGWREVRGRRNGQPTGGYTAGPSRDSERLSNRGPQWKCAKCATANDLTRDACRRCGARAGKLPTAEPQRVPQAGRTGPRPWAQQPQTKVTLGALVGAAKTAGASQDLVTQLAKEASEAKGVRQTPGGRLDSTRARAERAEKKTAAAREALAAARTKAEAAEVRLADLEREEQAARAELHAVEDELARARPSADAALANDALEGARGLLEQLGRTLWTVESGEHAPLPGGVLDAMRALHAALEAAPSFAEVVAAAANGERTLDEVADVAFGDADFDEEASGDETAPSGHEGPSPRGGPASRDAPLRRSKPPTSRQREGSGSRTPPRRRPGVG